MSTHDVDLAVRWADEVAVVVGRTVIQGAPRAVLGDGVLPRGAAGLLATLPGRPGVPT
jgi:cobalt/nickel transport system ATP-binding protein